MSQIFYSESFIRQAQVLLRKMIEENLDEIPYGKPFNNFKVIIGQPRDRLIVAIVDVPQDLKVKIGDKKVYVVI